MEFPNLNSVEDYYQELIADFDAGKPDPSWVATDYIEAKEVWWEYNALLDQMLADDEADQFIPPEIYDLKDRWL